MNKKLPMLSLVKPRSADVEPLPEIEKDRLIRILRGFGIFTESTAKPYLVSFTEGSAAYAAGQATIEVATHGGGSTFSPFVIEQIIVKFKLDRTHFLEAYAGSHNT